MVFIVLVFLGLCFGSFINAYVWRIHNKKNWIKERSVCVNCGHELAAKDLVPVFSWLLLKGKCRYCGKPISRQYPLVEALTALLFVFSYIYWPFAFNGQGTTLFVFWLVFLVGLIALAIYDIKWMILPNKMIYPFIVAALVQAVFILTSAKTPFQAFISLIFSILIGGGLFYLVFQISDGKWIGGGDVKLGALLGLILADWELMFLTIFTASVLGTLVTLPLIATKKAKKNAHIPFGPFLIAGAIFARLLGLSVINWYKQKFAI